ncbi:uncharacterized protein LOC127581051 [Pristis pectinata]|uniref:uncharacterized protein LOC127581051 n=1 Tax=Pristis pectinata TaxID=685728 RepID=UPI00223D435E|nr:uncharacterized protein LOC127581051 [Pristis pectinata]
MATAWAPGAELGGGSRRGARGRVQARSSGGGSRRGARGAGPGAELGAGSRRGARGARPGAELGGRVQARSSGGGSRRGARGRVQARSSAGGVVFPSLPVAVAAQLWCIMRDLSEQIPLIVEHLLDEDFLETDGTDPEEEEILKVAQCLRKLGDDYNQKIQPYMKKLQPRLRELAKDQASDVFSGMVTELCSAPELQTHLQQLGPEMSLLGIAVVLGMNISKEVPDLLPTVKVAMTTFINTRLLNWIQSSGGWWKIL